MSFLSRSRYGPFIYAGVGVALIMFALVDTTVSRLVLVVGGLAIGGGLATRKARLGGAHREQRGRP
jgi:hypothetical protein